MKHNKLFRILAMAVIMALLMVAIPITPALAAASMTVSPDDGPPGEAVTVTGSGFTTDGSGYVWFDIDGDSIRDSGEPYVSVTTTSGGDLPAGVTLTVPTVPRGTYSVYADVPSGSPIEAYDTFTITPEIELDDSSGNVGDTITVDGYGFRDSATVTIYYDGVSVGTDYTNSDGTFDNFTFTVPDSTKGTHTVRARDSTGYSPTVNFTVSPEITISSSSGAVGDAITVSGTGFAASSDITIYFDGDEVDITGGDDDTDSDGSFECTFDIPETSRGSHTIKAKDEDNNYDTATFTVAQKITIDPTSGSSGITVTVTGTGFGASKTITIKYDDTTVATSPTTVTTNLTGYFSATFTVPAVLAGTYEVEATDGTNTATADFVSTTDATISQTTTAAAPGYVGMTLTITGTGFTPSATITITYTSDPAVFTTTSLADGSFSYVLTIPPSLGGAHTITVSDGSVTKVFDFFMELEAPPVPELLLPLADEKAESEAEFDWDDVTDISEPVTYDLQVATSASFTSTSILVDKEGLTESEYILTESEKLESTSEEEPYYWRVRAVDAASNASGWTGAATFYVGFTFPEITGWLMYVIMAAIAAAFFFFGFWLGKRRASSGDEFA